jgi:transketolase
MEHDVPEELVGSLEATAREIRRDVIRMTCAAGSGHPGTSFSVTDLLTALVFHELRVDPTRPGWPDRDRLVLSKEHAAPALYAALVHRGFLPREELLSLPRSGRRRSGPVDRAPLPGLEASIGGSGEATGMAVGMALDARLDRRPSCVFAVLSEAECQAGATWEALLAGGHHQLRNLVVVLNRNGYEPDGPTEAIVGIEPVAEKFRAFRFHTLEIDGHDFREILGAFASARATTGGPTAIVASTVTGKGVSFLENVHDPQARALSKAEAERALIELGVPPAEAVR